MEYIDRIARALAFVLLFVACTNGDAAEFVAPVDDGWHVWRVQGVEDGTNACCYRWRNGSATNQGCDLDEKNGQSIALGDCDLEGDKVSVYVRIKAGDLTKVRALTSDCPVTTQTQVNDMGVVTNAASVAWLALQIDAEPRALDDAIAAISTHAGDEAFAALTTLLEDRNRKMNTREQALFWLAQRNSDRAFEYLDALISSN